MPLYSTLKMYLPKNLVLTCASILKLLKLVGRVAFGTYTLNNVISNAIFNMLATQICLFCLQD